MLIDVKNLESALKILGDILADRGLHYEVAAIGGGGLLLLGLIDRTTKDLDLVALVGEHGLVSADPLPKPLLQAAEEVGGALNLDKDWLNVGPASLLDMGMPPGFRERLHVRKYRGLTLFLAARFDQICFKLYATVDQGPYSKHYSDLRSLAPSIDELQKAKSWCITHDVSSYFEADIDQVIRSFHESN